MQVLNLMWGRQGIIKMVFQLKFKVQFLIQLQQEIQMEAPIFLNQGQINFKAIWFLVLPLLLQLPPPPIVQIILFQYLAHLQQPQQILEQVLQL